MCLMSSSKMEWEEKAWQTEQLKMEWQLDEDNIKT